MRRGAIKKRSSVPGIMSFSSCSTAGRLFLFRDLPRGQKEKERDANNNDKHARGFHATLATFSFFLILRQTTARTRRNAPRHDRFHISGRRCSSILVARTRRSGARTEKKRVCLPGGGPKNVRAKRARTNERRLDYSITIFPLFLFRRILYEWSRGLGEIISRAARRDATRRRCPPCALYKNRRTALRGRSRRASACSPSVRLPPSAECSIQNI